LRSKSEAEEGAEEGAEEEAEEVDEDEEVVQEHVEVEAVVDVDGVEAELEEGGNDEENVDDAVPSPSDMTYRGRLRFLASAYIGLPAMPWMNDAPRSKCSGLPLPLCGCWYVHVRPPMRSRASRTSTSTPASARVRAHERPDMPAPITMAVCARVVMVGWSGEVYNGGTRHHDISRVGQRSSFTRTSELLILSP
jgi:hypothetical protein